MIDDGPMREWNAIPFCAASAYLRHGVSVVCSRQTRLAAASASFFDASENPQALHRAEVSDFFWTYGRSFFRRR
jgi:hypothetical protein